VHFENTEKNDRTLEKKKKKKTKKKHKEMGGYWGVFFLCFN